jgi:hypothetical protein
MSVQFKKAEIESSVDEDTVTLVRDANEEGVWPPPPATAIAIGVKL